MIEPHAVFEVITPDEVAECWNGVYRNEMVPDLYEQLWNLTEKYDKIENKEDSGPHDHIGTNAVQQFWKGLPEPTQLELNRLASLNGQ
jgi:hypothetical protein